MTPLNVAGDGQQGPGQRCSNCATYDDECTFVQSAPKVGLPALPSLEGLYQCDRMQRQARPRGYVQRLEARVAAMEALLARLCPASDLSRELDAFVAESIRFGTSDFDDSDFSDDEGGSEDDDSGTVSRRGSTSVNPGGRGLGRANSKPRRDAFTYAIPPAFSPTSASSSSHHHPGLPMSPATSGLSSPTADSSSPSFSPDYERPSDAPHEEDPELESSDDEIKARQALSSLALDPNNVTSNRYFGKSSNILILKKALELKCAYAVHARADNNLQATLDNLSVEEKALRDKVRSFDAKLKTNVSARTGACYDPHKQRMRPLPCLCPAECPVHPVCLL